MTGVCAAQTKVLTFWVRNVAETVQSLQRLNVKAMLGRKGMGMWDPTDVTKPGTLPCTDLGPSPSHPTPHFPWSLEGKYAQAHYLLSKHGGPGPGCRSSPSIPRPHLPAFFWGAIPFLILRVSPRLQLGPRFSPSTKPWLPHRDQSPSFRGAPHKQVNPITVREPPRTATGAGIHVVLLMMGRMGTSVYIQGLSLP